MKLEDFKCIGIGLADARLLIERYKTPKSKHELADIVANVRGCGSSSKKTVKNTLKNIDFVWKHYCDISKTFKVVKISNGGGVRRKKMDPNITCSCLLEAAAKIYFPDGKSSKGPFSLMTTKLLSITSDDVSTSTKSVEDYIMEKSLKQCKFVFRV